MTIMRQRGGEEASLDRVLFLGGTQAPEPSEGGHGLLVSLERIHRSWPSLSGRSRVWRPLTGAFGVPDRALPVLA